jgi:hypothetical protein
MDSITLVCVGGVLDGQEATSRFPKGFLAVDKPAGQCWLYDIAADSSGWILREGYPQPWDRQKSWLAAEGVDFDVLAVDYDD